MSLNQALRYPFQGEHWLRRILALAVVQLVPVLGLLVLFGYGMAVARSARSGESGLPEIHWVQAFADGLRFILAALLYVVPLVAALPAIFALGTTHAAAERNAAWTAAVLMPVVVIGVFPATTALKKRGDRVSASLARILSFVPLAAIVLLLLSFLASGLDLSAAREGLNAAGVILFVALGLLVLLLVVAVQVGAVRQAQTGHGLFDPPGNLKALFAGGARAAQLIFSFLLLMVITVVASAAGLLLFVLPGLFVFVVGALSWWRLLAAYVMEDA